MSYNSFLRIVKRYLSGKASKKEKSLLEKWIMQDEEWKRKFERAVIRHEKEINSENKPLQFDYKAAFERFRGRIESSRKRTLKVHTYLKYAAAAVVLGGVYLGYLVISHRDAHRGEDLVVATPIGKNKIVITNSRGLVKAFENKGTFSYLEDAPIRREKPMREEIYVPKGQLFRLTLSDGTVVWLNADTKLTYPSFFSKTDEVRNIYLEGEAFFDVVHRENQPFVVNTNNLEIRVLGTKFDVSSYKKDRTVETTLVQGSVKVADHTNPSVAITIKPGTQAKFQKDTKKLSSKKVEARLYTSWMDSRIVFENMSFDELMDRIERLYDVEIVNNNPRLRGKHFTGEFDIETVDVIFKSLATSIYFKYKINDRQITIEPD